MIQEQYVSFETAKLLKEKGFNELCYLGYNKNGEYFPTGNRRNSEIIQPDFCLLCAPTQQMAMRWLREVHNIYIVVEPHSHNGFKAVEYEIMYWHEGHYHVPYQESHPTYHPLYGKTWNTYEEACEAAIRYCLEHLI